MREKFRGSSDAKTLVASSIESHERGILVNHSSPNKYLEEKKEVTYSAYGINLENTVKLLSCSKQVSLVAKSDIKTKRFFVTS